MNVALIDTPNNQTTSKPKRKILSNEGGEDSAAAKQDRLRISSFQNFWRSVHEHIVLLRSIGPIGVSDNSIKPVEISNLKKVGNLLI